jgi:4'-phosphopantetheinyl transferase
MIPTLSPNHIDVWLLPIDGWDPMQLDQGKISLLLSEKEYCRFQRFRPLSKKAEFIAARLLLRHLLLSYTSCNIVQTEAIPDEMGRPFWYEKGAPLALFFSLSHTKNLICCALSHHREIGCDVESLAPRKYERDLTDKVMSDEELQFYRQLHPQDQSTFFYRSWTLKEAFVKALGQGLRIPFTALSFTHMATIQDTFTVLPENLGKTYTKSPYCFKSCQPNAAYSLGVATPLVSANINLIHAQLTGEKITVVSR